MFLKCLLLLFFLCDIDAQFSLSRPRTCPYPRFDHGRFRMRQKSKLIKFICFPGYELAGNKYATCRDGEWDVPLPVCVKSGCTLPSVENGIPMISHAGAWVVFFCYPRHKLIGSPVIYCDGRKWNATAPACIDTTAPSRLSCNFEDPNLCGWTQDELHDFDWKRLNKKTPSSFLFTGPSYDHTYGESGNGYYMYIESTSRLENDTARLVSPLFDANLAKDGCFSFFYHMFGKTTGGLRIYQKPEKVPLPNLLQLLDTERQKYLLFEKWGNQGDEWFSGVGMLTDFADDFQIVIEGIRGTSFTSDIAIDDVAILQGENCTIAKNFASTPVMMMPDSCANRCDVFGQPNEMGCGCTVTCVAEGNCCPDFFDVCIFDSTTPLEDASPAELPQTQKLVAPTITIPPTTPQAPIYTSTTTSTSTTTTTTKKPTTTSTTTQKPTTKLITTTKRVIVTTKKLPTIVFKTTTSVYNKTGEIQKDATKEIGTIKPTPVPTTRKPKVTVGTTTVVFKKSYLQDTLKAEKEQRIEKKMVFSEKKSEKNASSGFKTTVLTITGLLCLVGAAWLFVWSRGSQGRKTLARLRGRARNDPDVRYLHSADDVDD